MPRFFAPRQSPIRYQISSLRRLNCYRIPNFKFVEGIESHISNLKFQISNIKLPKIAGLEFLRDPQTRKPPMRRANPPSNINFQISNCPRLQSSNSPRDLPNAQAADAPRPPLNFQISNFKFAV
jgi:hypothetical protein